MKSRYFKRKNEQNNFHNDKGASREEKVRLFRARLLFLLLAFMLLGAGTSGCEWGVSHSEEVPVEPTVAGQGNDEDNILLGRFTVVNPEIVIYELAVSDSGEEILFSSDARAINMLDDQGRLLWEAFFDGNPVDAAITSLGDYVAVGTDEGKVIFFSGEGRKVWESSFPGEVSRIALSSGGEYLAVAAYDEEEDRHTLYFFSKWGQLLWEKETALIEDLHLLPWGELYVVEEREEQKYLVALSEKEVMWEEEVDRVSFSENGRYFAAYYEGELYYYNIRGDSPELLWSYSSEQEADWLGVTERGEHVIAYSTFAGGEDNLFFLDREGELLWKKRIPGGALVQHSKGGEKIVVSSWQEYSEDFSKVMVVDIEGDIVQEVEMASRIEKIALSDTGSILALAASDGNIFILGISAPRAIQAEGEEVDVENGVMYRPIVQDIDREEQFVTLYFYDERGMQLIPVNRKVNDSENLLQSAVDELVKGPRRLSGLSRTIPKDISLETWQEDDLVYLDLPPELNRMAGSAQAGGMIDSLLLTVSEFSAVGGISFLVDGQPAQAFGTEELPLKKVFPPKHLAENEKKIYIPYFSGTRYYILPQEADNLPGRTGRNDSAEEMVDAILSESRRFLPLVPELRSIRVTENEIILDWESCFEKLFPEDEEANNPEEEALAKLLVDALLLTLAENFAPDELVFKVEGKQWSPPNEELVLQTKLQRPFYINPE